MWNILPHFDQRIWLLEPFLALRAGALELTLLDERIAVRQLPLTQAFQSLEFLVAAWHITFASERLEQRLPTVAQAIGNEFGEPLHHEKACCRVFFQYLHNFDAW